jgi:hypothetical protein
MRSVEKDETMRRTIKIAIAILLAGAYTWALAWAIGGSGARDSRSRKTAPPVGRGIPAAGSALTAPTLPRFRAGGFETGGYSTAAEFTGPIADRSSIAQLCAAFATRGRRGIAGAMAALETTPHDAPDPTFERLRIQA